MDQFGATPPSTVSFAAKLGGRCDGPVVHRTSALDTAPGPDPDIVITEHPLGSPPPAAPFRGTTRLGPFAPVVTGGVSITGRLAERPASTLPPDFRVTAVVPAFNEADIIGSTIEYLIDEGVDVY